jgi:hypothetical protein
MEALEGRGGTRWGEWSAARPGRVFTAGERTPGTHCTGGWVDPRAGLDTEVRGKILCPCRGSNFDRPVVQPVVRHYTAWATPAPENTLILEIIALRVSLPGRGDEFLNAIKTRSTSFFGWEVKREGPMSLDFTACKRSVDVWKMLNTQSSHSCIHSSRSLHLSLLVGLPASSGRQVRGYPQPASSPRLSAHIHPGDEQ